MAPRARPVAAALCATFLLVAGVGPSAGAVGIDDPDLILPPTALPLPAAGTVFADPVFGTRLRRLSDTSVRGGFETQIYSQLQALSSDDRYVLLVGSDGYLVRHTDDGRPVENLDTASWNAPRWHPRRANVIVHFDDNADTVVRVQQTDVETRATTTRFTFPASYHRVRANQSFDELSEDGRWLAGMVSRSDGADVVFALDLDAGRLGAVLALPDLYAGACAPDPLWGEVEPDWIGVSPLGRSLVVQWPRDGTERCSGLETFDLESGAFLGRVSDGHQHGDLGVDADGTTEFFMTFEIYHPSGSLSIGVRRLPGEAGTSPPSYVRLLDWGNAAHISCRGPHGVCLVTAGRWADNGFGPFEGEIFLQYTDGRVLRLAHHRSSECGYWVQPRATLSRDGRFAVFASDWGRELDCPEEGLGRGDPYLVELGEAVSGPGDPIPGGGPPGDDCLHEWRSSSPALLRPNGLPRRVLTCTDGDPACDAGEAGDGACTFRVASCFGTAERRFACAPARIGRVRLPSPPAGGDSVDTDNRNALRDALVSLGGEADERAVRFRPALRATPRCTALAEVRVPLVGEADAQRRGQRVLRLEAWSPIAADAGRRTDADVLRLVCDPAPP